MKYDCIVAGMTIAAAKRHAEIQGHSLICVQRESRRRYGSHQCKHSGCWASLRGSGGKVGGYVDPKLNDACPTKWKTQRGVFY